LRPILRAQESPAFALGLTLLSCASTPIQLRHPITGTRSMRANIDEAVQRAETRLPATEGRLEDGTYVIQLALPGVDPKDVAVSVMDGVLTVKGERKPDDNTAGKEYFVREIAYGTFQRSFRLPEGVDAAQVEAKSLNGMLEVRVAMPLAVTPRTIEVKAA
jgi:HSP20 family protein